MESKFNVRPRIRIELPWIDRMCGSWCLPHLPPLLSLLIFPEAKSCDFFVVPRIKQHDVKVHARLKGVTGHSSIGDIVVPEDITLTMTVGYYDEDIANMGFAGDQPFGGVELQTPIKEIYARSLVKLGSGVVLILW